MDKVLGLTILPPRPGACNTSWASAWHSGRGSQAVPTPTFISRQIAGCDQTTQYQCGISSTAAANPNMVNLNENPIFPGTNGDTYTAAPMPNKPIVRGTGDSISTAVYPYQINSRQRQSFKRQAGR